MVTLRHAPFDGTRTCRQRCGANSELPVLFLSSTWWFFNKKAPPKWGFLIWWRGGDLNSRPSGYEPDELPDCSTPRRLLNHTTPRSVRPPDLHQERSSPSTARWTPGLSTSSSSSSSSNPLGVIQSSWRSRCKATACLARRAPSSTLMATPRPSPCGSGTECLLRLPC